MLSSLIRGYVNGVKLKQFEISLMNLKRSMTSKEMKNILVPPSTVRGMTELNREAFCTKIQVPRIVVKVRDLEKVLKLLKPFILKIQKLQPVVNYHEGELRKSVLLNPNLVSDISDVTRPDANTAETLRECEAEFVWDEVELKYENWKSEDILDAVLPEDKEKTTSYSRIGHIIHLNLRDHLKDYRYLVGQVLLDKLQGVRSVVNKMDTIDSEFRNFNMEILAGDGNMVASVKENGCTFEFDFSRVFWNPRLCTEHERVTAELKKGDSVLYDLFAGVGPFSIPAAKFYKCDVLANDLNPDSFHWLKHNVKLNKVEKRVQAFNMDAREFVQKIVKEDLISRWNRYRDTCEDQSVSWPKLYIVMNLPALAVGFLDSFVGLLSDQSQLEESTEFVSPTVYCYMFIKEKSEVNEPISKVETILENAKLDLETTHVSFVRSVAPNKEMMKICFKLPKCVLFKCKSRDQKRCDLPQIKRAKLDV